MRAVFNPPATPHHGLAKSLARPLSSKGAGEKLPFVLNETREWYQGSMTLAGSVVQGQCQDRYPDNLPGALYTDSQASID